MNSSLSKIAASIRRGLSRHSPEILTGVGIGGMITAAVMAVRATPKALILLDNERIEKDTVKLTALETVKTVWLCYIPASLTGFFSILCLIGANSVNARRNAALATAFSLSETALKEYQDKVVETIGEKKEQSVRDAIAKDKIDRDPVSAREVYITEKGNTLCYDTHSGRYFKSDIEKLRKAMVDLNYMILSEMYVSLNDFYYEIGLTNTKTGDILGWHVDDGKVELRFSSQLADDETPCLVLDYSIAPKYGYKR